MAEVVRVLLDNLGPDILTYAQAPPRPILSRVDGDQSRLRLPSWVTDWNNTTWVAMVLGISPQL